MLQSARSGPPQEQGSGVLPAGLLTLASDEQLAAYVRGGSARAFEALFERHHAAMLAFCEHMLGSRADAEDAVQQTFIAAYRDLSRGSRPRALRPWLYGISRRRCLRALAERRAQPDAGEAEEASDHLASGIVARSELRAVFVDLAALPQDQREALVLAELEGLSHDEIAELLGCRRGKVKALVFQARAALATGRAARDTSCAEVREQLETLRGAALRRRVLQRHLRDCAGCREFRDRVGRRRPSLGLLLPLATAAALKRAILGAVFGGGGGGALAGGSLGLSGVAATVLVAAAVPAGVVGAKALAGEGARPAATTSRAPAVGLSARVAGAPVASHSPAHPSPVTSSAPASVPMPRPTSRGEPAPDHAGTPPPEGTSPPAGTSPTAAGPPGEVSASHDGPRASAQDSAGGSAEPPGHAKRESGDASSPAPLPPEETVGNSRRPHQPPGQAKQEARSDRPGPPAQPPARRPSGTDRRAPPSEPPGRSRREQAADSSEDGRAAPPGPPTATTDHPQPARPAPAAAQDLPAHGPLAHSRAGGQTDRAGGTVTVAPSPPTPPTRSSPSAARCGC